MICVKYNAACLGNFMCQVLKGQDPAVALDYGNLNTSDILHTGAYDNVNNRLFKEVFYQAKHTIISHNNPNFDDFLYAETGTKFVFISLNSHFIEYRLNFMHKMPDINEQSNLFDTEAWRDFDHPIASADARRIFRLHQDKEQEMKSKSNDIVFPFANFYKEKNTWVDNLMRLAEKLNIHLKETQLFDWHESFKIGQKDIIARAIHLRNCIEQQKFTNDLNENEKGLIIGHVAVKEGNDDANFFDQLYKKFSAF